MERRILGFLALFAVLASSGARAYFESYPGCQSRPYGTTRNMVIAPNGDAIVTGCLHTGMEYDAILTVRYRGSDGSVIWSAKYGDTLAGNSGGTAIAIDASGNVFVTGYTAGASGKQLLVGVKYDGARGAQLWASTFAAYGHAQANAIAVDGNGDVYVTGQSEDPPDANGNIRTVKYGGTTGAQIWTASFDGYGRSGDVGRAIVADAAGHVFVTGGVTPTTGGSNFRTIAYDAATGAQVWTGEVGADGVDSGVDAAIDSDGNVVVAGSTVEAASGGNYRVIQYDSASGAIRWTTAVPGTPAGRGAAQSVGIDASGNDYLPPGVVDFCPRGLEGGRNGRDHAPFHPNVGLEGFRSRHYSGVSYQEIHLTGLPRP